MRGRKVAVVVVEHAMAWYGCGSNALAWMLCVMLLHLVHRSYRAQ